MTPEQLAGATLQQPQQLTPLQMHHQQVEFAALGEAHDVCIRLTLNVKYFSVEARQKLMYYLNQMGKAITESFGEGGNA